MSGFTVNFTDKAAHDLDEILTYISSVLKNPSAAKSFYEKLEKTLELISFFPFSAKVLENPFVKTNNIRQIPIDNYLLYYLPDEEKQVCTVLTIFYGKRNIDEIIKSI